MNTKNTFYNIISSLCLTALMIFCTVHINAAETLLSDPDIVTTGIEFRGVPNVKLGDSFAYGPVSFGGMAEMRNESRFNQGALPNHNWRGFVFLYSDYSVSHSEDSLKFTCGFEHESAHPTKGFNEGNFKAYDKIYDNTYRNINLNSGLLRISGSTGSGYKLTLTADGQFYFYSRNTPELPVNKLTWSEGVSGGAEFKYPLSADTEFFVSGFDRYIFQSIKKTEGGIYHDTADGVETRYEKYPVINSTNTICAKTGLIFSNLIQSRKVSLYCGILYGNIFGFVDSRENRTVYSFGIEISH